MLYTVTMRARYVWLVVLMYLGFCCLIECASPRPSLMEVDDYYATSTMIADHALPYGRTFARA